MKAPSFDGGHAHVTASKMTSACRPRINSASEAKRKHGGPAPHRVASRKARRLRSRGVRTKVAHESDAPALLGPFRNPCE